MLRRLRRLFPGRNFDPLESRQGIAGLVTFFLGAFLLILAVFNGLFFATGVFIWDNRDFGWLSLFVLGFFFLISWIVAAVCIKTFDNQLLGRLVDVLSGACIVYTTIIYIYLVLTRLYDYQYALPQRFLQYLFAVVAGLVAVILLQFLHEQYRLMPYSFALLVGSLTHLVVLKWRYVELGKEIVEETAGDLPTSYFAIANIYFFIFVLLVGTLMLQNAPVFRPLHSRLDQMFRIRE